MFVIHEGEFMSSLLLVEEERTSRSNLIILFTFFSFHWIYSKEQKHAAGGRTRWHNVNLKSSRCKRSHSQQDDEDNPDCCKQNINLTKASESGKYMWSTPLIEQN